MLEPTIHDNTVPMITLYQFPHSPFCIPVRLILAAAGTPFQIRNVSNANRAEVITLTNGAYYQVPVIVDERSGRRVVYESGTNSQDVAHYLDREFSGGRLFPPQLEGIQEIILQNLESEVEGLTFKLQDPFHIDSTEDLVERTMIIRHKERKFGKGCVEQWRRAHGEMLMQAACLLLPYEKMLQHSAFLLGDKPVYSDYLLAGILGNITYNQNVTLPDSLPLLAEFLGRLEKLRFF